MIIVVFWNLNLFFNKDLENTIAQTIPKSDSKNFVKLKTRKK